MILSGPERSGTPLNAVRRNAGAVADRSNVFFDIDTDAGRSEWGRPGSVFSARLGEVQSDGRRLLETPHFKMSARGGGKFQTGDFLRLLVEKDVSGAIFLRVIDIAADGASPAVATETLRFQDAMYRSTIALGLPSDSLSFSLISFFRAFGLRLDPSVLKLLRRTILRSTGDRENLALAATAATSKGVSLSDASLAEYADAVGPDVGRRGDREPAGRDRHEDDSEKGHGKRPAAKKVTPDNGSLRAAFDTSFAGENALAFLNKLSGQNGSRWLVFPLRLSSGSVEFRAVVRILLITTEASNKVSVERIAIDAAMSARTWFFTAENPSRPNAVMHVSADPPFRADARRIEAALRPVLEPLGFRVDVAENDTRRFGELSCEPVVGVDEEA